MLIREDRAAGETQDPRLQAERGPPPGRPRAHALVKHNERAALIVGIFALVLAAIVWLSRRAQTKSLARPIRALGQCAGMSPELLGGTKMRRG